MIATDITDSGNYTIMHNHESCITWNIRLGYEYSYYLKTM